MSAASITAESGGNEYAVAVATASDGGFDGAAMRELSETIAGTAAAAACTAYGLGLAAPVCAWAGGEIGGYLYDGFAALGSLFSADDTEQKREAAHQAGMARRLPGNIQAAIEADALFTAQVNRAIDAIGATARQFGALDVWRARAQWSSQMFFSSPTAPEYGMNAAGDEMSMTLRHYMGPLNFGPALGGQGYGLVRRPLDSITSAQLAPLSAWQRMERVKLVQEIYAQLPARQIAPALAGAIGVIAEHAAAVKARQALAQIESDSAAQSVTQFERECRQIAAMGRATPPSCAQALALSDPPSPGATVDPTGRGFRTANRPAAPSPARAFAALTGSTAIAGGAVYLLMRFAP